MTYRVGIIIYMAGNMNYRVDSITYRISSMTYRVGSTVILWCKRFYTSNNSAVAAAKLLASIRRPCCPAAVMNLTHCTALALDTTAGGGVWLSKLTADSLVTSLTGYLSQLQVNILQAKMSGQALESQTIRMRRIHVTATTHIITLDY